MMFELVPLWMAFIFGVVAAIIIECCLFCWNHSVIEHYMGLAADRMVEIADVRQENIELRHKVDEYKDQRIERTGQERPRMAKFAPVTNDQVQIGHLELPGKKTRLMRNNAIGEGRWQAVKSRSSCPAKIACAVSTVTTGFKRVIDTC